MATPSKIPLLPMEGRKGRLRPSLYSACSRLYAANGVELLTQTGIPSLTHLRITGGPKMPSLFYPPADHCFPSTHPPEGLSFSPSF